MIRDWAILCPGQSLARVSDFVYEDGGLIAVNAAIMVHKSKGLNCDWWALRDPEVFKSVFERMSLDFVSHQTVIWTHWNFGNSAEITAGWKESMRDCFRSFLVLSYGDLTRHIDLCAMPSWESFSVFCAVALAMMRGAITIRIYGMDMAGAGYFLEGFENERTNHSASRWKAEAAYFREIQAACAGRGTRLILEHS